MMRQSPIFNVFPMAGSGILRSMHRLPCKHNSSFVTKAPTISLHSLLTKPVFVNLKFFQIPKGFQRIYISQSRKHSAFASLSLSLLRHIALLTHNGFCFGGIPKRPLVYTFQRSLQSDGEKSIDC